MITREQYEHAKKVKEEKEEMYFRQLIASGEFGEDDGEPDEEEKNADAIITQYLIENPLRVEISTHVCGTINFQHHTLTAKNMADAINKIHELCINPETNTTGIRIIETRTGKEIVSDDSDTAFPLGDDPVMYISKNSGLTDEDTKYIMLLTGISKKRVY